MKLWQFTYEILTLLWPAPSCGSILWSKFIASLFRAMLLKLDNFSGNRGQRWFLMTHDNSRSFCSASNSNFSLASNGDFKWFQWLSLFSLVEGWIMSCALISRHYMLRELCASHFRMARWLIFVSFRLQDNGKESRVQRGNLEDKVEQGRLEDNRFREGRHTITIILHLS